MANLKRQSTEEEKMEWAYLQREARHTKQIQLVDFTILLSINGLSNIWSNIRKILISEKNIILYNLY